MGLVKQLPGRHWSRSKKCWYIPEEDSIIDLLPEHFSGKAFINYPSIIMQEANNSKHHPVVNQPEADARDAELVDMLRK